MKDFLVFLIGFIGGCAIVTVFGWFKLLWSIPYPIIKKWKQYQEMGD